MASPRPLVALLTDFGPDSWYLGAMKGALLDANPALTFVDVSHGVEPQDLGAAAYILLATWEQFPAGSVFLVVVDPGVGGERRGLAGRIGERYFVAPDNGLVTELVAREPDRELCYLENPALLRSDPRPTFHGRDVFAGAAAHLTLGMPLAAFGSPCERPVLIDRIGPRREGEALIGRILLADSFGNLITDIDEDSLRALEGERQAAAADLEIQAGELRLRGIRRVYEEAAPGEALALLGSSGHLEIAVARGSASDRLGLSAGEEVVVHARPRRDAP